MEGNAILEFLDQFTNLFAITAIGFAIATIRYRQFYRLALKNLVEKEESWRQALEIVEKENRALKKKLKAATKASQEEAKEEVANE